jgi:hypothetical protein
MRVWSGPMLGVLLATFIMALPASVGASLKSTKTLRREQDPVIVRTGTLTGVPDRETSRYRLYAVRDGRLEPIPFQFDSRGPNGELVLSEDGRETEFTFGADDELVFMARDTGDRAPDEVLDSGLRAELVGLAAQRRYAGTDEIQVSQIARSLLAGRAVPAR